MRGLLHKKGIQLSFKTYFIDAMSFMALGLFASLIIGLIIQTAADQLMLVFEQNRLLTDLQELGQLTMSLMGPAIGVAVAYSLKAPKLVLFAAVVSGAAGATLGGPAGSLIAAIISTEIGKLVSGETKLDMIITPFVTITTGFITASFIGPWIQSGLQSIGTVIVWATEQQPIIMGVLVATIMGLALTAPISSAALAIMLEIEGIAAGAATIGCAAQMVGFAVSSYRDNGLSGLVSQGLGTSMLQMPNIIKNPIILIPPTVAGMVLAPIGIHLFGMVNNAAGAGMGTSGLVGPIMMLSEMGFNQETFISIFIFLIVAPAFISLILSEWLRKIGKIKAGDMKIQQE
ncbi:PTS transporter subunit IIC [Alkalihalobacillus pseudalcaliphilus]|uniref:PTS transporter subunit IIC n=1 Tax=Alkalihalobacillus pseudalcaliphilus TaxID=79884 RepID=UPI00064DF74F|nr:PTS sugar transporter subunit IIC [Alkalihalobacillus pseudalcaliphilus]KMK77804.1 PTS sugar transporter subunit IIC [Alkalihalobacillus pseudalcaliphilus]